MKKYNVAVVGATGMVGRKVLEVLEERNFPVDKFYPLASARSKGEQLTFMGQTHTVQELTEKSFEQDIDIAIFSAGGGTSEKFSPIAAKNNVVVVDNSSAFRMNPDVPLVVPEVNPEDLNWHKNIIANPNCSTIQAVVALKPLHKKYGIKRIVYSTYQAVSGSGIKGYEDLENGVKGGENKFYPHQIAFNCLPHIDVFLDNGYTKEEVKMIEETKKILGDDSLKITATAVRVPVFYGHSESVNLEFNNSYELDDVRNILANSPGIILEDDVSNNIYPLARNAEGKNEVFVGRIRRDDSVENGLNLWVVADNIRKGAAANAVQIAELLIKNNLLRR